MLEIKTNDLDFEVSGYVSLPEVTRASRNYLSTIINGRYIKNFMLNKAIINGYGSKLMVGRFPIAVIEVTMDPLLVDVNVHPTKQEVRLSKEKELMTLITQAIEAALSQEQLIPNAAANLQFKKKVEKQPAVEQMEIPLAEETTHAPTMSEGVRKPGSLSYDSESGRFFVEGQSEQSMASPETSTEPTRFPSQELVEETATEEYTTALPSGKMAEESSTEGMTNQDVLHEDASERSVSSEGRQETLQREAEMPSEVGQSAIERQLSSANPFPSLQEEARNHPDFDMSSKDTVKELNRTVERLEHEKKPERFPVLEYFGQMHGTYLFAQSKEGLYIIDQHAAQERIKYEYFREKIGEVSNDLQELLVPIVLDYPNSDVIKINEQKEQLESVGIYLEDFGQNSFIVRAHPTWYPGGEEEEIIRGMIDMLLVTGQVSVKKFREATAIMMSCKRSIKANHYLNEQQARILLNDLAECANPFNCPHGRPVLIHFTNSDMEKMFKRIQDPH